MCRCFVRASADTWLHACISSMGTMLIRPYQINYVSLQRAKLLLTTFSGWPFRKTEDPQRHIKTYSFPSEWKKLPLYIEQFVLGRWAIAGFKFRSNFIIVQMPSLECDMCYFVARSHRQLICHCLSRHQLDGKFSAVCGQNLSLIHIWRCRRSTLCRSRWSPYH